MLMCHDACLNFTVLSTVYWVCLVANAIRCYRYYFMVRQYCLPSIIYGSVWYINDNNLRSLDIAWTNAFRKMFNGLWRESVKPLLFYCRCLPITFLANLNKLMFWKLLANPIVRWLATGCKDNMHALACIVCLLFRLSSLLLRHIK